MGSSPVAMAFLSLYILGCADHRLLQLLINEWVDNRFVSGSKTLIVQQSSPVAKGPVNLYNRLPSLEAGKVKKVKNFHEKQNVLSTVSGVLIFRKQRTRGVLVKMIKSGV
jgi:hypothetical protein